MLVSVFFSACVLPPGVAGRNTQCQSLSLEQALCSFLSWLRSASILLTLLWHHHPSQHKGPFSLLTGWLCAVSASVRGRASPVYLGSGLIRGAGLLMERCLQGPGLTSGKVHRESRPDRNPKHCKPCGFIDCQSQGQPSKLGGSQLRKTLKEMPSPTEAGAPSKWFQGELGQVCEWQGCQ